MSAERFDPSPTRGTRVVVMGVSGSGKTTMGELLARELHVEYADADDFHTPANVAKMSAGTPLTDDDRWPWLDAIGRWLAEHETTGGVVTCSALKLRYRDALRTHAGDVWFLYCEGSLELIKERVSHRSDHFMPASQLQSQFEDLEPPGHDERAVCEDVSEQPAEIVRHFVAEVARRSTMEEERLPTSIGVVQTTNGYAPDLAPDELAFQRLYGPWQHFTPDEVRGIFRPIGIAWWIAGGYAVEAFTGIPRHHEDIDVSIFRKDVPALRAAFEGRMHIWSAGDGLRPVNDDFPEPRDGASQVWLREHALAPWKADVLLNPDDDGRWVSRRDPSFVAPLDDVTWERDGLRYLRPEIALAFKAKLTRPKDERDLSVTLPLLSDSARTWLADFLARIEPEHAWRDRL